MKFTRHTINLLIIANIIICYLIQMHSAVKIDSPFYDVHRFIQKSTTLSSDKTSLNTNLKSSHFLKNSHRRYPIKLYTIKSNDPIGAEYNPLICEIDFNKGVNILRDNKHVGNPLKFTNFMFLDGILVFEEISFFLKVQTVDYKDIMRKFKPRIENFAQAYEVKRFDKYCFFSIYNNWIDKEDKSKGKEFSSIIFCLQEELTDDETLKNFPEDLRHNYAGVVEETTDLLDLQQYRLKQNIQIQYYEPHITIDDIQKQSVSTGQSSVTGKLPTYFSSFSKEGLVMNLDKNYNPTKVKYSFRFDQVVKCRAGHANDLKVYVRPEIRSFFRPDSCCISYMVDQNNTCNMAMFCSTYLKDWKCKVDIKIFKSTLYRRCMAEHIDNIKQKVDNIVKDKDNSKISFLRKATLIYALRETMNPSLLINSDPSSMVIQTLSKAIPKSKEYETTIIRTLEPDCIEILKNEKEKVRQKKKSLPELYGGLDTKSRAESDLQYSYGMMSAKKIRHLRKELCHAYMLLKNRENLENIPNRQLNQNVQYGFNIQQTNNIGSLSTTNINIDREETLTYNKSTSSNSEIKSNISGMNKVDKLYGSTNPINNTLGANPQLNPDGSLGNGLNGSPSAKLVSDTGFLNPKEKSPLGNTPVLNNGTINEAGGNPFLNRSNPLNGADGNPFPNPLNPLNGAGGNTFPNPSNPLNGAANPFPNSDNPLNGAGGNPFPNRSNPLNRVAGNPFPNSGIPLNGAGGNQLPTSGYLSPNLLNPNDKSFNPLKPAIPSPLLSENQKNLPSDPSKNGSNSSNDVGNLSNPNNQGLDMSNTNGSNMLSNNSFSSNAGLSSLNKTTHSSSSQTNEPLNPITGLPNKPEDGKTNPYNNFPLNRDNNPSSLDSNGIKNAPLFDKNGNLIPHPLGSGGNNSNPILRNTPLNPRPSGLMGNLLGNNSSSHPGANPFLNGNSGSIANSVRAPNQMTKLTPQEKETLKKTNYYQGMENIKTQIRNSKLDPKYFDKVQYYIENNPEIKNLFMNEKYTINFTSKDILDIVESTPQDAVRKLRKFSKDQYFKLYIALPHKNKFEIKSKDSSLINNTSDSEIFNTLKTSDTSTSTNNETINSSIFENTLLDETERFKIFTKGIKQGPNLPIDKPTKYNDEDDEGFDLQITQNKDKLINDQKKIKVPEYVQKEIPFDNKAKDIPYKNPLDEVIITKNQSEEELFGLSNTLHKGTEESKSQITNHSPHFDISQNSQSSDKYKINEFDRLKKQKTLDKFKKKSKKIMNSDFNSENSNKNTESKLITNHAVDNTSIQTQQESDKSNVTNPANNREINGFNSKSNMRGNKQIKRNRRLKGSLINQGSNNDGNNPNNTKGNSNNQGDNGNLKSDGGQGSNINNNSDGSNNTKDNKYNQGVNASMGSTGTEGSNLNNDNNGSNTTNGDSQSQGVTGNVGSNAAQDSNFNNNTNQLRNPNYNMNNQGETKNMESLSPHGSNFNNEINQPNNTAENINNEGNMGSNASQISYNDMNDSDVQREGNNFNVVNKGQEGSFDVKGSNVSDIDVKGNYRNLVRTSQNESRNTRGYNYENNISNTNNEANREIMNVGQVEANNIKDSDFENKRSRIHREDNLNIQNSGEFSSQGIQDANISNNFSHLNRNTIRRNHNDINNIQGADFNNDMSRSHNQLESYDNYQNENSRNYSHNTNENEDLNSQMGHEDAMQFNNIYNRHKRNIRHTGLENESTIYNIKYHDGKNIESSDIESSDGIIERKFFTEYHPDDVIKIVDEISLEKR